MAALDPLAKPRPGTDGARDERTAAARRADALVDLCRYQTAAGLGTGHSGTSAGRGAARAATAAATPDTTTTVRRGQSGILSASAGGRTDPDDAAGLIPADDQSDSRDIFSSAEPGALLPSAGSMARPRLTITIAYDVLTQELGYGLLDTGQMLTADVGPKTRLRRRDHPRHPRQPRTGPRSRPHRPTLDRPSPTSDHHPRPRLRLPRL